jgi:hypothetical protein
MGVKLEGLVDVLVDDYCTCESKKRKRGGKGQGG